MALQRQGYLTGSFGFGIDGFFSVPPMDYYDTDTITVTASSSAFADSTFCSLTGTGFTVLKQRQSLNSLPDALRATHLIGFDNNDAPCVMEIVSVLNDTLMVVKQNQDSPYDITALDFLPVNNNSSPCTSVQLSATADATYQYAIPQNLSTDGIVLTTTEPLLISNPQGIEPILIKPSDIGKVNLLCTWGAY